MIPANVIGLRAFHHFGYFSMFPKVSKLLLNCCFCFRAWLGFRLWALLFPRAYSTLFARSCEGSSDAERRRFCPELPHHAQ